jgi:tetratricopeptide (TPR) repeat protein
LDAYDALTTALGTEPGDGVAAALLGTLLYDNGRRREAVQLWERAIILGMCDPVVYRNAGLGAYNVLADDERAWHHYEEAIRLDPHDARLLYERDQLARRLGHSPIERIRRLEAALAVTQSRDDLVVAYAELLVAVGRESEAIALLESRQFQPWEGGEGLVLAAWDRARAAAGLEQAEPPASLGEGRPQSIPPAARSADGSAAYFATSLPELLLFSR